MILVKYTIGRYRSFVSENASRFYDEGSSYGLESGLIWKYAFDKSAAKNLASREQKLPGCIQLRVTVTYGR